MGDNQGTKITTDDRPTGSALGPDWMEDLHMRGVEKVFLYFFHEIPGPGCSKLTTLLVNVSLKFQNINIFNLPIFFVEKM